MVTERTYTTSVNSQIHLFRATEPDTTLFKEETDVILTVIFDTLERYAPRAQRGTFILDGQKYGEDAQCILRFNLPDGACQCQLSANCSRNSEEMAEESIDGILASFSDVFCCATGDSGDSDTPSKDVVPATDVGSGIWRANELRAVVLNATYGRFLFSCYIENTEEGADDGDKAAEAILLAITKTIAHLDKGDSVLQSSYHVIENVPYLQWCHFDVSEYIEHIFFTYPDDVMRTWKSWHDAADSAGKLTLFFM